MKTLQTGVMVSALIGATVAAGILATAKRGPDRDPPFQKCAQQPTDGGRCFLRRPDGGFVQFGRGTQFNAKLSFGECEVSACLQVP